MVLHITVGMRREHEYTGSIAKYKAESIACGTQETEIDENGVFRQPYLSVT